MVNVTIYKKRDIWWMQYRINGTRVRKTLSTKTESVARRKAKAYEENLIKGEGEGFRGRIKLEPFWEEFLPHARSTKRPKTVHNDVCFWNRFSNWLNIKKIRYIDQVSMHTFEAFRLTLLEKGLKKSSINIIHRHLSSIFSFAVKRGFIEKNPIKKVKKFKIEQKAPRFLSKDEINRLLIEAKNHSREMHLICSLGIYAGFRSSEIANARWEWFDLDNDVIVIQPYGGFIPKSHRMRPIPLNHILKENLQKYHEPEGFLLNSDIPENERKSLIRYDFKNSFKTTKKKADLEWVTPHILRHTFASQLAKAGVSLYKIQQWLGHSDPKTTMIYAHLQAQDDEINLI